MLRNLLRREVKYQRIEITSALRKQAFFNVNWIVFLNNYEVLVIAEKNLVILNVVTNQSYFIDAGTVVGAIKMFQHPASKHYSSSPLFHHNVTTWTSALYNSEVLRHWNSRSIHAMCTLKSGNETSINLWSCQTIKVNYWYFLIIENESGLNVGFCVLRNRWCWKPKKKKIEHRCLVFLQCIVLFRNEHKLFGFKFSPRSHFILHIIAHSGADMCSVHADTTVLHWPWQK